MRSHNARQSTCTTTQKLFLETITDSSTLWLRRWTATPVPWVQAPQSNDYFVLFSFCIFFLFCCRRKIPSIVSPSLLIADRSCFDDTIVHDHTSNLTQCQSMHKLNWWLRCEQSSWILNFQPTYHHQFWLVSNIACTHSKIMLRHTNCHNASPFTEWEGHQALGQNKGIFEPRSEERRVGKECRSRWSPYH